MAKRHANVSSKTKETRVANSETLKAIEGQVIAIAEQLGRIAGAAQARADGWVNQRSFQVQLAKIRERASQLLHRLGTNGSSGSRTHPDKRHLRVPSSVSHKADEAVSPSGRVPFRTRHLRQRALGIICHAAPSSLASGASRFRLRA